MQSAKDPSEVEHREAQVSAYCHVRQVIEEEVDKYKRIGF